MPNHSLPSHLLDWLWIGLSTGPNGAAAEMIPSSIAASAYWRGWTLKAWRYFLSRLLQGVRKGSFSRSHNGVVFVPVRLEPLLRLNIMAEPDVTGAATGACGGKRHAPRGLKLRELAHGFRLQVRASIQPV